MAAISRKYRAKGVLQNFEDVVATRLHLLQRVLVVGSTQSGKTNMIYHIAHWMQKICNVQMALAMSKTEGANGNYGGLGRLRSAEEAAATGCPEFDFRLIPKFLARDCFDPTLLKAFIGFMKRAAGARVAPNSLVFLDDVMCDKKVVNSPVVAELLMNARNFNIGCISAVHGTKQFTPEMREQFRFIVVFNQSSNELKKVYELFFKDDFKTFSSFKKMFNAVMKQGPFWTVAIDLKGSGNVLNRVFKWRAPHYKMGHDSDGVVRTPHLCDIGFWALMRSAFREDTVVDAQQLFDVEFISEKMGLSGLQQVGTKKTIAAGTAGHDEEADDDMGEDLGGCAKGGAGASTVVKSRRPASRRTRGRTRRDDILVDIDDENEDDDDDEI
jgi:hypothetical protein